MQVSERSYLEGEGFMTVRHLKVCASNFEIGRRIGEIAIQRYGKSASDYEADPMYTKARRTYLQHNYPICWERTRGVAAAFGKDAGNDLYDFTMIPYNVDVPLLGQPGCSVVYYPPTTTATGRGYLSRNYDFSTGTMADLLRLPLPPAAKAQLPAIMSEPYVMEWHPVDGGHASLAIHAFDALSGTLDGINDAGLVVSILADEEAMAVLGPRLEMHLGMTRAIGAHELQVMRWVLDTCATADEAKELLLTAKQYYWLVPCHYVIADRHGNSFIYENSTGRNVQHIIEGVGTPQVITNFQIHKHPNSGAPPHGGLTIENNAFWRYAKLAQRISEQRVPFTPENIRDNNACVSIQEMLAEIGAAGANSIAANLQARTLWHALYDQEARSAEFRFYLGGVVNPDGTCTQRLSDYLSFTLEASGG